VIKTEAALVGAVQRFRWADASVLLASRRCTKRYASGDRDHEHGLDATASWRCILDFRLSAEHAAFQQEVRQFVDQLLPDDGRDPRDNPDFVTTVRMELAKRG